MEKETFTPLQLEGGIDWEQRRYEIAKEVFHVDWDVSAAEKGGYEHFMIKEIMEQPKAIEDTVCPRIQDGNIVLDDIKITKEQIKNL